MFVLYFSFAFLFLILAGSPFLLLLGGSGNQRRSGDPVSHIPGDEPESRCIEPLDEIPQEFHCIDPLDEISGEQKPIV